MKPVMRLAMLSVLMPLAACDDACTRLAYVDLYGPDEITRTVVVNARACETDQSGLWLRVGPGALPMLAQHVDLPTVPAGTCLQVGHPAVQWGTEHVKAEFGSDAAWPDYAAALGQDDDYIDGVVSEAADRRDVTAPLRQDEAGAWHEVAWYGGDCSLLPVP